MLGVHVNIQFGPRKGRLIDLTLPMSREMVEIVRLLIEQGADVTAKDKNLSTPLHLASSVGIPESVQLLIGHGADINAEDMSRRTPLHLASALSWVGTKDQSLLCLTSLM